MPYVEKITHVAELPLKIVFFLWELINGFTQTMTVGFALIDQYDKATTS